MNIIKELIAENGVIYLISQVISIIATFFLLISYQQPTHKRIVGTQALAALLFGTQYLMIGQYPGMICNYIGMVRAVSYSFRTKSKIQKYAYFTLWKEGHLETLYELLC